MPNKLTELELVDLIALVLVEAQGELDKLTRTGRALSTESVAHMNAVTKDAERVLSRRVGKDPIPTARPLE